MSIDVELLRALIAEYEAEMATSRMVDRQGRPSAAAMDPVYRSGLRGRVIDSYPVLLDEIERLRGLVCEAHGMQRSNYQSRQGDGSMQHGSTAFCLVCDWHWRSGDPGDCLKSHAAHVDALLDPKET